MEHQQGTALKKVGTVLAQDQIDRLRTLRVERQRLTRANVSLADVIRDVVEAGLSVIDDAPISNSTASTEVAA
jgi:hypothetical protein